MNSVQRVKTICKERKIPISKLEKDLGFANGYIGQLRKGVFPEDRLFLIAEYLELSVEFIRTGENETKEKTHSPEGEGLIDAGYNRLTPENKAVIDNLIEQLLKAQSVD